MTSPKPASAFAAAVVGGGPAGLMGAQVLSAAGCRVTVYDQMPTPGRKLLMAGRGGLNLTHSEPFEQFLTRYGEAAPRLKPYLEAFTPADLVAWAQDLGQPTFVGSSGRVFPKSLKASPLLRAWLARLAAQGVDLRTRRRWLGWDDDGALVFEGPEGRETARPDATLLALGGASWPGLGSDGAWAAVLTDQGVKLTPFSAANSGFAVSWSEVFRTRFAGSPLKAIAVTFGETRVRGEAMIAGYGLEGGAIYALSARLREAIARDGSALIHIDLRPDLTAGEITARLARGPKGASVSTALRKALALTPAAVNLLREAHGLDLPAGASAMARVIKAAPLRLTGVAPLARAISTAGGVTLTDVDEGLMLRGRDNVFAAGEMLDWEAPTGGYLLQATLATGAAAARAMLARFN
jgi:uncharacterized flavoprotein (TIGR03862 family)